MYEICNKGSAKHFLVSLLPWTLHHFTALPTACSKETYDYTQACNCDAAGEASPDSAAVKQLMHVVEGLEEELFTSEARRNDAEVILHPSHMLRFWHPMQCLHVFMSWQNSICSHLCRLLS